MSEKADRPEFIRHYTEIMEARPYLGEVLTGYGHGEKSYEVASFGKKLGLTRIGIHLEVLAPGYRSSLPTAMKRTKNSSLLSKARRLDRW